MIPGGLSSHLADRIASHSSAGSLHQGFADVDHSRVPGVPQARGAKLVFKGHHTLKAAAAAERNAIVTQALFGCFEDDLQSTSLSGRSCRPSKVRQQYCVAPILAAQDTRTALPKTQEKHCLARRARTRGKGASPMPAPCKL
ncbi:hypothetical protein ABBQ32_007670 [Trebouxia sp. C0010 RCD-2024]